MTEEQLQEANRLKSLIDQYDAIERFLRGKAICSVQFWVDGDGPTLTISAYNGGGAVVSNVVEEAIRSAIGLRPPVQGKFENL